ncbi:hypothetical protein KP509_11G049000 [Ceratopteris richardii]|nr:hypothetical protein KP509_11G049000 [Ceratopteris richardii]
MLSLLFIGIKLEQEFGLIRIGILYVLSGFGGSLLSALFLRNGISVGASGALFGLLGAMLSELLTNWTIYSNKCAALMTLALVVALNLAVGILPNVDNFAHIGGFFSGFLLGFVLLIKPQFGRVRQRYLSYNIDAGSLRTRQKHQLYQYILFGISLIIVIVGFVIATIMVFRGVDGNKKCSWCHYLNCVPTSRWKCSTGSAYCTTSQLVNNNQVQLTCLSNNKTTTIAADQSQSILESLCGKLCS